MGQQLMCWILESLLFWHSLRHASFLGGVALSNVSKNLWLGCLIRLAQHEMRIQSVPGNDKLV